jgi:hypothetical protein
MELPSPTNTLFFKILYSFFPDLEEEMHKSPVGMFLSFVSAKKYYTFVIKKIIDHYKTNYFDLARDPFDTTMVLGPQTRQTKARDTDPFYAYHCVAHMNGYTFYSPSMVGINIALV